MKRRLFFGSITTLCALTLAACNGGGGGGATADLTGAAATGSATQTSSSVVSYGAITGFGSVFVNGTRFDVSHATVSDDGRSSTADDLAVGQIVRIEAERGEDGSLPRALRIDRDAALEGPIESIDAAASTLIVLGQTVVLDADTLFDDDISPASLEALAVGDNIEVDAFVASDGSLHATRIERDANAGELEITGRVADLDTTASTFRINALTVLYAEAALDDFGGAEIAEGDLVEVKGEALNDAGALVATRIERKRFDDARDGDADDVEMEGLVTRFASSADFDVNGRRVATTEGTRFENGGAVDLALGIKVEVEGHLDADGVLVAEKVSLRAVADVRIEGDVEAVDSAAGTLRVLGVTVAVDAHTRFDDHGPNDDRFLSLAKLAVGDRVEVRGRADADAGAGVDVDVLATRLERDLQDDARVELEGLVGSIEEPNLTVLGTTVATLPGTEFEGVTAADLFAAVGDPTATVGFRLSVRGTWDGATLVAERVEVEREHD